MWPTQCTGRRRLLCIVLIAASLISSYFYPTPGKAQPPLPSVPIDPFDWVKGLDDLHPREHGPQLSRSAPAREPATIPLPDPAFAVDFAHYPTSAEISIFLQQLQSAYPELVRLETAGQSWQGRPLTAVRLGNQATGDPDARPALYVDGQHHAQEAISGQAVLYFLWYLAAHYEHDPLVTHLLDTRTVYAIPCVNPDGNDIFLTSDQRQRRTANPTASDDDEDGQFDEDGREGAGWGTYDVYHYTFAADWVAAHPDYPFADGWSNHLLSRVFVGVFDSEGHEVPQTDDDGDGRAGEDPPGGVDPNRNYDSHWELGSSNPRSAVYRGPAAFSEPETRAVRDCVLAHPHIATALSFHSGHDILLHPWSWSTTAGLPDAFWYEMLSRKGSQLTEANGFRGAPHTWTARGLYLASGSTIDWLYEQGILAWTPEIYGASELSFAQRITTTNTFAIGQSLGEGFNPLPADIPRVVDRWLRWSLYLLAATPNVGLSKVQVHQEGLNVAIANDGLLPLDVQVAVQDEQQVYTTTLVGLSAEERTWWVPLLPSSEQTTTITLTAQTRIGTSAREPQVEVIQLQIEGEVVRTVEGRLESFVHLGDFFGGWWAGVQWDTPEYHLGPPLLLAGDLDGDNDVDIVDIMLVASRWGSSQGDVNYDVRYDLDGDGDIDVVDIMLVAAHWGTRSTPVAQRTSPDRYGAMARCVECTR